MKSMKEFLSQTSVKIGSVILAAAIVFSSSMYALDSRPVIPELVTFQDDEGQIEIVEDDTPLASQPVVNKSTKTSKKTKKIKMKKAAAKTYNKKGKTTSKTKKSTSKSGYKTTTTEVNTKVSVVDKYKKGSKIDTRITTTQVTTTTTTVDSTPQVTQSFNGSPTVRSIAPKVDSRVASAFEALGFKITLNANVNFAGLCDARSRTITLKKVDSTVYHELGHFLAFIAGNMDTSAAFVAIYNAEKSKYTAYNKAYVLSSSSEYFAESFKNYTENPGALQSSRPQTYAAIQRALNTVTNDQVTRIKNVYSVIWG